MKSSRTYCHIFAVDELWESSAHPSHFDKLSTRGELVEARDHDAPATAPTNLTDAALFKLQG
jgi:hypothetical protein